MSYANSVDVDKVISTVFFVVFLLHRWHSIIRFVLMHFHTYVLSENKNKKVKNFQLKFIVFTALKSTVYCIGVFAYVDKIIGNKSYDALNWQ